MSVNPSSNAQQVHRVADNDQERNRSVSFFYNQLIFYMLISSDEDSSCVERIRKQRFLIGLVVIAVIIVIALVIILPVVLIKKSNSSGILSFFKNDNCINAYINLESPTEIILSGYITKCQSTISKGKSQILYSLEINLLIFFRFSK